jgi:N-dimethylarginine dimethylaminohydrolase
MASVASAGSTPPRSTFLMCAPRFFDVQYVINPWMEGNLHAPSASQAQEQWQRLHAAVREHAEVLLVEPQPGLPDMVFTANAGLVCDGVAALSRFRCVERSGEEAHFRQWFLKAGLEVREMPADAPFEGEGDALFTPDGARLWAGYGWRTAEASHTCLRELWPGCEVVPLRLTDPRFYHLDTCFAPLANGELLYYPAAFDAASLERIEAFYSPEQRIAVGEDDALRFACNAVNVGERIVLNKISDALRSGLEGRGYRVTQVGLSEFLKAGGAAKCLCLRVR